MTRPVPAEWSPHRAIWVGFPSHPELWEADLGPAQAEAAALANALAGPGGERVRLMVCGAAAAEAAALICGDAVEIVRGRFGDIWLRDTAPIFVERDRRRSASASTAGAASTCWRATTRSPSRSPRRPAWCCRATTSCSRAARSTTTATARCSPRASACSTPTATAAGPRPWPRTRCATALGARKVIWLGEGLLNDHTDGHVDNLARFVAPGVVAVPVAFGEKDPHAEVYDAAAQALAGAVDAAGRTLKVVRIPSPGRVLGADELPVPASHMNFVIANRAVIVPTYGGAGRGLARRRRWPSLFPGRAGDRPALARPAHRRRLVPLHHPAGAGLMAPHPDARRDPGLLRRRPRGQHRQDPRLHPRGGGAGRAGDPAARALPGPLLLRRAGGALVRRRRIPGASIRASPRWRRWPASSASCCRSRSSSARGRTTSTAW